MKKIIFSLLTSFVLTGCAINQRSFEIPPEIRLQYDQTQNMLKSEPVALLVNPCLLTNEIGQDLILAEASRLSSDKFIQSFKQQLDQQGIKLAKTAVPFICGSMPEYQLTRYGFKPDSSTARAPITSYPLLNQADSNLNTEQKNAVLALNQLINDYLLNNRRLPNHPKVMLSELDQPTLDILQKWSDSNYLFIVDINGLDASLGSHLAMAALSTAVTLARLNVDDRVHSYLPREGKRYTIQLYDLSQKKLLWSKTDSLQGKVFSTDGHSLDATAILDPLFELNTQ